MLENASYLFDILGVGISFVTIMLLLSLVIMAIQQVIQNIFRLRFKNLAMGVYAAVQSALGEGKVSLETVKKEILSPPVKSTKDKKLIVVPARSWIEPDDLISALTRLGLIETAEDADRVVATFKSYYTYMSKRFFAMIRYVGFVIALLVALAFQVDTFDLLRKLSSDPEMRIQLEQVARGLTGEEGLAEFTALSYEDISDSALVLLQARYRDLAPQLEQASGIGEDREAIIEELSEIMADERPEMSEEVLAEYADILDGLHRAEVAQGLERYEKYAGQLALFDIKPLQHGWEFYGSLSHLLGMLVTAILLTLGAPFWYQRLYELINLKDALKPKTDKIGKE